MLKSHTAKYTETREETIVDSIICNKCGREFVTHEYDLWRTDDDTMEINHFKRSGGYGSKIGDGLLWEIDLCDDCVVELLAFCKVPPKFVGEDGIYSMGHLFDPDYDVQKDQEEWLARAREQLISKDA
ncbi:MAG: hypothetical protein Q8910_00640 [Bacteroidota bacterium]|nr:hypothetical protein [Bacteroidota bacterium]